MQYAELRQSYTEVERQDQIFKGEVMMKHQSTLQLLTDSPLPLFDETLLDLNIMDEPRQNTIT